MKAAGSQGFVPFNCYPLGPKIGPKKTETDGSSAPHLLLSLQLRSGVNMQHPLYNLDLS